MECCAWRLFEPWLTIRLEAPLWMGRLPQSKHCAWPCEDTALLHILRPLLYSDVIDVDVGGFVRQLNRAHRNWHLKICVPAYVALRTTAWALEHAGQFVLYKLTITVRPHAVYFVLARCWMEQERFITSPPRYPTPQGDSWFFIISETACSDIGIYVQAFPIVNTQV